jgi:acyl-CoA synthetase (AMP-forming)/AMP-acid ligase II
MNPAYTPAELSRQLAASRATVLVAHADSEEKVEATLALCPGAITTVVYTGGKAGEQRRAGSLAWADLLASSSGPAPEQAAVDLARDVAVLPFSSGTTGVPKGVMLSQRNLVTNNVTIAASDAEYMIRASGTNQEVTIGVLPMFHIFGLNVTMSGGLHHGAKHVVVPSFNPAQFVRLMTEHRPTFLHLVPPLASFLANSPLVTREHLASLRQLLVGAAPSGPQLIEQFYRKAPKYVMYKEGWGSTEVAGAGSGINRATGGIKMGSVNQLLPNLRMQV